MMYYYMKLEIQENPGEQNSSQVGSKTSGEMENPEKVSLMADYNVHVASLAYNLYIAYHHYVEIPNGFLGDITQLTCELDYCLEKPVTIHINIDDNECIWVDQILFEICKTYKGQDKKGKLTYHSIGDLFIEGLFLTRDGSLEVWIGS